MKLEAMIKRRDLLVEKLRKSQYHYQGNIAVPNSLLLQWDSWKFRIAHWNQKINAAIADSQEAKALADLKRRAGV